MSILETWPSKIYLVDSVCTVIHPYASRPKDEIDWADESVECPSEVEYIRADMAKEREERLIRAAYHSCNSLSNVEDLERATKLLFKRAKLEELK